MRFPCGILKRPHIRTTIIPFFVLNGNKALYINLRMRIKRIGHRSNYVKHSFRLSPTFFAKPDFLNKKVSSLCPAPPFCTLCPPNGPRNCNDLLCVLEFDAGTLRLFHVREVQCLLLKEFPV